MLVDRKHGPQRVSLALCSYGIAPGLVFSFPVQCASGQWSIVQGVQEFEGGIAASVGSRGSEERARGVCMGLLGTEP